MPKFGGRIKGVPNKEHAEFAAKLKELKCDPLELQAYFALGDWKKLGYKSEYTYTPTQKGEVVEKLLISPEIRQKAVSDLLSYIQPKLKAIQHSGQVTQIIEDKLSTSEIEAILKADPFLKKKSKDKAE